MNTRRNFIKNTTSGLLSATALGIPGIASAKLEIGRSHMAETKINLGLASYSLRTFSLETALDMSVRVGLKHIALKSMHLPLDSDLETLRNATTLCRQKGIDLYGGGVIYMKIKEEVDQAFNYAKGAQMKIIIGVPSLELLDYVEEKVKAYDIKLAIHNHGPGDEIYPSPEHVFKNIKDRDPRMGLCIDIGHTVRMGRNPAQDLKTYFDRVFDVHLKDVNVAAAEGEGCIMGRGVIDLPSFVQSAVQLGYQGVLAIEYEAEENDPLAGLAESAGYAKGILSTI
ncbi:MAG: sugar phosphate isomerase/epimerase [Maribacter sp.]|nr:sugar phosphate isomerase/epimerase [Maribacter sp.]